MIHNLLHPGELVKETLIEGAGLSVTDAAYKLGVDRTTLSRLINGHSGISPEMAYRLSMLLELVMNCGSIFKKIMIYGVCNKS